MDMSDNNRVANKKRVSSDVEKLGDEMTRGSPKIIKLMKAEESVARALGRSDADATFAALRAECDQAVAACERALVQHADIEARLARAEAALREVRDSAAAAWEVHAETIVRLTRNLAVEQEARSRSEAALQDTERELQQQTTSLLMVKDVMELAIDVMRRSLVVLQAQRQPRAPPTPPGALLPAPRARAAEEL